VDYHLVDPEVDRKTDVDAMTPKAFKDSFDEHRDSCLAVCEEWCKKERNPLDDLKHKVKDPIRAYYNNQARWAVWKVLDRIKTLAWLVVGNALWSDPKYQDFYQWLAGYWGDNDWNKIKMEYSTISPKYLKDAGFREGDELWYWSTPEETWKYMFGRAGYCIVRNGMIIWSYMTEMN